MALFKGKYRIESARWNNWDYAQAGAYFVTICTKDRLHFLGDIVYTATPIDSPPYVDTVTPVVETPCMASPDDGQFPDDNGDDNGASFDATPSSDNETPFDESNGGKETHSNAPLPRAQRKNWASIIRGFKSAVTVQARSINPAFGWQPRYHDQVIRNEIEYYRITQYIINNSGNWKGDRFHGMKSM